MASVADQADLRVLPGALVVVDAVVMRDTFPLFSGQSRQIGRQMSQRLCLDGR